MKQLTVLALLLSHWAFAGYVDNVFDDYHEEKDLTFHSQGLFSFGVQSNTAHIRKFFARGNYQKSGLQLFTTLNGYKDTHGPSQDYTFILNNINLYDYGFTYQMKNGFFFSGRGAATYRENHDTYLLFSPHIYDRNPGETDEMPQYLRVYRTGPGIRLGYHAEKFEVGYSQGDFRHSIPSAFLGKINFGEDYARLVVYSEYENPLVFDRNLLYRQVQMSYAGMRPLSGPFNIGYLAEVNYHQLGRWWVRLEEAIQYEHYTLAMRELKAPDEPLLLEVSLKRNIENLMGLGLHYSSNGRVYLAASIDF